MTPDEQMAEFLRDCVPAAVELERLGNWAEARKERFWNSRHRTMLTVHEMSRAKFAHQVTVNESYLHRQTLNDPRRTAA